MRRIYVHGLGQTPASWDNVIRRLKPAGGGVRPDLAGLCRGGDAAYQSLYQGFSKICGSFEEKIDLCGLSLGGVLALNYAIEHPEKVNSLALIAAQYKMPRGLLRFQNILFQFMPESRFQQTGFGKNGLIRLCRTMMELDFSHTIQNVACPALVVCGARDSANKKAAMELAGLLKDAELRIISGAGHEVNTETPEKLAETLQAFYNRVQ